jgi:hypothetical protein
MDYYQLIKFFTIFKDILLTFGETWNKMKIKILFFKK